MRVLEERAFLDFEPANFFYYTRDAFRFYGSVNVYARSRHFRNTPYAKAIFFSAEIWIVYFSLYVKQR